MSIPSEVLKNPPAVVRTSLDTPKDIYSRPVGFFTTSQFLFPPNIFMGLGIMPMGFETPESRPLWPP